MNDEEALFTRVKFRKLLAGKLKSLARVRGHTSRLTEYVWMGSARKALR